MTFNLTTIRLEALRYLAAQDDLVYVCALANKVFPRKSYTEGQRGPSYWPQQATRAGAGCARPLIEAGLVRMANRPHGWGVVGITPEGREVLAAFDRDDGSLPARLTLARERFLKAPAAYCTWAYRFEGKS